MSAAAVEDGRGRHERIFDDLTAAQQIAYGRQVMTMLDVWTIPSGQARTALRVALDQAQLGRAPVGQPVVDAGPHAYITNRRPVRR